LAASVVGSRWSLEKEERLQIQVRNVDIARPAPCGAASPFRQSSRRCLTGMAASGVSVTRRRIEMTEGCRLANNT
jgi:hypothetical protein